MQSSRHGKRHKPHPGLDDTRDTDWALQLLDRVEATEAQWAADDDLVQALRALSRYMLRGEPACVGVGGLMRDALDHPHDGTRGVLRGLLTAAVGCLARADHAAVLAERRACGLSVEQRLCALSWVAATPGPRLTPAGLAAALGISRPRLVRAIKTATGETPIRWLLRQRVMRAKDMLVRTEESLSEIAAACGFRSQSHLIKAFREFTGMTPRKWLRWRRIPTSHRER